MISQEENEILTRVGPGTPAGEMLRRYWHPIAVTCDLSDDEPTKFVRLLGEDLVLYKDKSGNVGLIQDHCPHRGASLLYGRVEERGIACAYHGWLYDTQGNCLETPAEPADSKFHLTVKATAYPVREHIGMFWAYLGPLPAPEIPHYDVWERNVGAYRIDVHPPIDANWFQAMENSVDPAHAPILHQETMRRGAANMSTTRGMTDDIAKLDFYAFEHGIMKQRTFKSGVVDEHPLLFPTVLRIGTGTEIRVPVDDTHMLIFEPSFMPAKEGQNIDGEPEVKRLEPFKSPQDQRPPFAKFRWDAIAAQDACMWETQGPIANRMTERLATSDRGVMLLREVVMEQIKRVAEGLDPMGVQRDPNHPVIDTNLELVLEVYRKRGEIWHGGSDPNKMGAPVAVAD